MVPEHRWLHQPIKAKRNTGIERDEQAARRRDPGTRKS
jgi:hypothetical protein